MSPFVIQDGAPDQRVRLLARRAVAFFIDVFIVIVANLLISLVDPAFIPFETGEVGTTVSGISPIGLTVMTAFLLLRDVLRVGKRVTRIHAVDLKTGQRVGAGKSALRNLPFLPFFCGGILSVVEFLAARLDPEGQRFMDRLCKTRVVPLSGTISVPSELSKRAPRLSRYDLVFPAPIYALGAWILFVGVVMAILAPWLSRGEAGRAAESMAQDALRSMVEEQRMYHAQHNRFANSFEQLDTNIDFNRMPYDRYDFDLTLISEPGPIAVITARPRDEKSRAVAVALGDLFTRFYLVPRGAPRWESGEPPEEWMLIEGASDTWERPPDERHWSPADAR